VITSIAMFYDLEDPNSFVSGIASILANDGVWVIEMHYLPLTISRNAFDAICHEHLEYYSVASLEPLLLRYGLAIADVETNEANGGACESMSCIRDPLACARLRGAIAYRRSVPRKRFLISIVLRPTEAWAAVLLTSANS